MKASNLSVEASRSASKTIEDSGEVKIIGCAASFCSQWTRAERPSVWYELCSDSQRIGKTATDPMGMADGTKFGSGINTLAFCSSPCSH